MEPRLGYPSHFVLFSRRSFPLLYFASLLGHVSRRESPAVPPSEKRPWFDPVNEPSFRLDVAGLSNAFEVLFFAGRESISEPFVFDVDLLIEDPTLDLASLLYRSASVLFGPAGNGIHGQLHELVQRDHGAGIRLCQVRLGPKLACLAQRFSQCIFSGRTAPQILDQPFRGVAK